MEKVLVRKKVVQGISSRIIRTYENIDSLAELCLKYGKDMILSDIFEECKISYHELNKKCHEFLENNSNEEFEIMYVLNSGFGVVINEHIYLCYCNEDMLNQQKGLFPWVYVESKKYIGDPWWFETDEIIEDVQKLSVVQFTEKYKGY